MIHIDIPVGYNVFKWNCLHNLWQVFSRMYLSLMNHNWAEQFERCLVSPLCQQWACRACGVCQQKESVGSLQVFGQTERKQQAVCQLECDGDIQNPNTAEMTLKFSADALYFVADRYVVGCSIYISIKVIIACTWHLAWLLRTVPTKWHAGGFCYWLMARSSSYIITNKDDSQDMINYL